MAEQQFRKRSYITHTDSDNKNAALFSHLLIHDQVPVENVHWAIRKVGETMRKGLLRRTNQCCKEVMSAFKTLVLEYICPSREVLKRHLQHLVDLSESHLKACRSYSFGIENAVQDLKVHLKQEQIALIPLSASEDTAKLWLIQQIENFMREKIGLAMSVIAQTVKFTQGADLIKSGDVILTYSYDEAVCAVLTKAASQGKDFRVLVVDSRPYLEGKLLLKELSAAGIRCTYMLITSISYHMKEVTRVLVGAIGVASNGALVNVTGTGMICCVADVFKVPVLVVSESYKFSERVQIDSICYNELGDQDLIVNPQFYEGDTRVETRLANWRHNERNLVLLNINFDVTLTEQISMLITEVGCVPVTSVPVILREYRKDTQNAEQARLFFYSTETD